MSATSLLSSLPSAKVLQTACTATHAQSAQLAAAPAPSNLSPALQERLYRRTVSHVLSFFGKSPAELAQRAVDGKVQCVLSILHIGSYMGEFMAALQCQGYDVHIDGNQVIVSTQLFAVNQS